MKALLYWGGWDGHTPKESGEILANGLRDGGATVDIVDKTDILNDKDALAGYDLVIPLWTMAKPEEITGDQAKNLSEAVRAGTGIGGVHGGMGDSVRHCLLYQWMTGSQFIDHPYVGPYTVNLTDAGKKDLITRDLPASFPYNSEQYYMLVDPRTDVLATTVYDWEGRKVTMPVVWTSTWGKGKVFYSALGHTAPELASYPDVLAMTIRGLRWAMRKR